ncbi:RNA polymerase II-associated protein 1 [Calliphora vicina]|uniref:RNA polymerase II-associated protein 1 n=1 Tax=Calliphora vicina TaxID=7373 RepID=UPI00325A7A3A
MMNRPKPSETEEDILLLQQKFLSEKAKNPKIQPAAQIVKIEKQPKKSLFAQLRQQKQQSVPETVNKEESEKNKIIYDEIHHKIVGDQNENKSVTDIIMGDIVENNVQQPKPFMATEVRNATAFPKIQKINLNALASRPTNGKSLFGQLMEEKCKHQGESMECEEPATVQKNKNLTALYGEKSVIVEDSKTAAEVHKENLNVLCQLKEEEILAERKKILESIDPALVALLANKRKEKTQAKLKISPTSNKSEAMDTSSNNIKIEENPLNDLPSSNPAVDLIERSSAEQWIHFDVVEKDKLEWMRDIPMQASKLKEGEKFEARFDWKGVLLPYSLADVKSTTENETDDRELYLHGDEPHRPGYTLQELFRLARSNVMQQRVTAFNAIAGILNIYQQGFYDQVLDLPITKIFFLLRFGFDDNTPAMLEVVGKALAYLFYNETDETLLDFTYENPGCHWQPCLEVLNANIDSEDPDSIDNLQKHLQQLQVNLKGATIKANVEENEEESKTTMSDFQLAETDLIDCFLRTNILQRIYFILNCVKPDNSTVSSCLKILIRLARNGKEVALQIINNDGLINCLFENFLPRLEKVDTSLETPPFYHYPQYLCLKLLRILVSCNLGIAVKLLNFNLIDSLENYLFNREDIKGKLIKVQIESLRILRCLFLLRVENNTLYRKFLSAFRYMLDWHYNHVIYEEGGPFLIRQHAASLLTTISSINSPVGSEVTALLGDILHDCCCNWFYKAMRNGVKEFSQATLLSSCLNCVTWYVRHTDTARFQNFIKKYLDEFIKSESFLKFLITISPSSIVIRDSVDRRTVHNPLPNVGSVIMNAHGPQLVIAQTYPIYFITALWRLMELLLERNEKHLFEILLKPDILEPLVSFLRSLSTRCNRYLATNFYAKMEMKLIFKLLCFEGFHTYFNSSEMLQIVYNYLCCLTAEQIPEIEELFERVIFNTRYIQVEAETLNKWRKTCLELVYPHYIVVSPSELPLMLPFSQIPLLPSDWPYFQLKVILQNYVENIQHNSSLEFSEREILEMTLNFVTQLEKSNDKLQIATPTEKLMYLMIAFMGPDSQFLDRDMHELLRQHLMEFYAQSQNVMFQFDEIYQGKCRFENLYALFVDHFQAASYGNELFSSLVLIPLAQKYNNKWRRRVWSDYASALRFLDCNENMLIGGLEAYLQPAEEEESLIRDYNNALNGNLLRANTLPHKIATHHVEKFKESQHFKTK